MGPFIRAARERAGYTASEFAERIAHSQTWLYRLESGKRTAPTRRDLAILASELKLTEWETRYLYMLARIPIPPDVGASDHPSREFMERLLYPCAWVGIPGIGTNIYNSEFKRIFKGAEEHPTVLAWHFGDQRARDIIVNWNEIADWWVTHARMKHAEHVGDPMYEKVAHGLQELFPEFKERWKRQVIPMDPSQRIWLVNDLDRGVRVEMSIRSWRHPYMQGSMLTGFAES